MVPNRRRRKLPRDTVATAQMTLREREAFELRRKLDTPLAELAELAALPVRIVNALEDKSMLLVRDVVRYSYESLVAIPNLGVKAVSELKRAVIALGLEAPAIWENPALQPPPKPAKKSRAAKKDGIIDLWG